MTSWRNSFHRHIGPGLLPGITIGTWLRVLRENRFAIDPGLLPRAVVITACSFVNTPFAWYETIRFGSAVERTKMPPPVFVIGGFHAAYQAGATTLYGASIDASVGAALFLHAVAFLPTTFVGVLFMIAEGISPSSVAQIEVEGRSPRSQDDSRVKTSE